MRIAYLAAGAGALRCGACAYDFLLISRLRQLAHDVSMLPVYTPVHTDLGDVAPATGVFLGGVSSYLRVHKPGLARTLRPFRQILDSSAVIELATHSMVHTNPRDLGELTLSVFQGTEGPHRREIERLVARLVELKPQAVMLSNTMLCSLAGPIRAKLQVPVFSSFLGEDAFIMDLAEPFRSECVALLRQHAKDLASVICPSQSALQQAGLLLQCPPDRLTVVRAPVDVDLFRQRDAERARVPTVGYLGVMRPAKGLDILLRAMALVAERMGTQIWLLMAGQNLTPEFQREVRSLAWQLPASVKFRFLGEVTLEQKVALWHTADIAVFPSRLAETRALSALEAMSCGAPIIGPGNGCFPELTATGGGWLFDPGSVDMLARQIVSALSSADRGAAAGLAAAEHARKFHDSVQVARDLELVLQAGLGTGEEKPAGR